MDNRRILGMDVEQEEDRDSEYGPEPAEKTPHDRVDVTPIKPEGTGCRACFILILLLGAVLGLIYFYSTNRPPTTTPPPPGQPQGYQGRGTGP